MATSITDLAQAFPRCAHVLSVALVCLAAPLAAAAEQIICRSEMSVADFHECRLAVLEEQEAMLNSVYEQALAKLHEEDADKGSSLEAALRDAQRAWLRFRDLTCAAETDWFEDRPDWRPAEEATCQQTMAVMRRGELEYVLDE